MSSGSDNSNKRAELAGTVVAVAATDTTALVGATTLAVSREDELVQALLRMSWHEVSTKEA
jgi:hypothetical protein